MHNAGKYAIAFFIAYLLTRFGSAWLFLSEFNYLSLNRGQVNWFILTCLLFSMYLVIIHYAFKFWCGKELYAQNKRDDYRSFERINLLYLSFNALGMFTHLVFLQVVFFFFMPIVLINIL